MLNNGLVSKTDHLTDVAVIIVSSLLSYEQFINS